MNYFFVVEGAGALVVGAGAFVVGAGAFVVGAGAFVVGLLRNILIFFEILVIVLIRRHSF